MNPEPAQLVIVLHDDLAAGGPPARAKAQLEGGLLPALSAVEASPLLKLAWAPSAAFCRAIAEHSGAAALAERLRALSAKGKIEGVVRVNAPLMLTPPGVFSTSLLRAQQAALQRLLGTPARGFWPEARAYDPVLPAILAAAGVSYCFIDSGALSAGGAQPDAGAWRVERTGAAVLALSIDRRLAALGAPAPPAALAHELRRRRGRTLCLALRMGALADQGPAYWAALTAVLVRVARDCRINVPWAVIERAPTANAAPRAGTPPEVGASALPEAAGEALLEAAASLLEGRASALQGAMGEPQGPPLEAYLARFDAAHRLSATAIKAMGRAAAARRANSPGGEAATLATARLLPAAALHAGEGGQIDDPSVRHAAWLAWLAVEQPLLPAALELEAPERPQDPSAVIELRSPVWLLRLRPHDGGGIDTMALPGLGNFVNTLERLPRAGHAVLRSADSLPELLPLDAETEGPLYPEDDDEQTDPGLRPAPSLPPAPSLQPAPSLSQADSALGAAAALGALPIVAAPPPRQALAEPSRLSFQDGHLRHIFVERLMAKGLDARALWRGQAPEVGERGPAAWRVEVASAEGEGGARVVLVRESSIDRGSGTPGMVQITRRMHFSADKAAIEVEWELVNRSREPVELHLLVELNVNLDGQLGPDRTLHTPGAAPVPFDAVGEVAEAADIGLRFGDIGALLRLQPDPPTRLLHHPIEGPLCRDGLIEAGFQGICLGLDFPVALWGEERQRRRARLELLRR